MTKTSYYNSKIGLFKITEEGGFIVGVSMLKNEEKPVFEQEESEAIKLCKAELEEYFEGKRQAFEVPILLKGTDFQKKVWKELMQIPYGKTLSYGQVARAIGKEKASRAVGGACNKNPILILVPCHRVVGFNGKLVGFALGEKIKKNLLELEKTI